MELLNNPDFSQAGADGELAADWAHWSPRDGLRPVAERAEAGIRTAGNGCPGVWGALRQTVTTIRPGHAYGLRVRFAPDGGVACLHDSIDVVLQWRDAAGELLQSDFGWRIEAGPDDGGYQLDMTAMAPDKVASLDVHLVFHWSADGSVTWRHASLREVPLPKPRMVTVSVLAADLMSGAMRDEIWDHYGELLETAGCRGSDLAVGPEFVTGWAPGDPMEHGEPIPGPTSDRFAGYARAHRMYVTAAILERDGDLLHNTAFLLDRDGQLVGKYRKVHPTQGEIFAGVTPGHEAPVFDCDFGRIGMTICFDNKFPDLHRAMVLNGAEMLVSCTEGDGREGGFTHEIVAQARAINNGVWVVASGRASPNTGQQRSWHSFGTFIISPEGYILSNCGKMGPEVQTRTIDMGRSMKGSVSLRGCETWNDVWRAARRPNLYPPLSGSWL